MRTMVTPLLCYVFISIVMADECPPLGSTLHIPQDIVCANGHPECDEGQEAWTLTGCGCGCKLSDDTDDVDDAVVEEDETDDMGTETMFAAESDMVYVDGDGDGDDATCPPSGTTQHIPQDVVCEMGLILCPEGEVSWTMVGCGCGCLTVGDEEPMFSTTDEIAFNATNLDSVEDANMSEVEPEVAVGESAHVQSVLHLEGLSSQSPFASDETAFDIDMHEVVLTVMIVLACVANISVMLYACLLRCKSVRGRSAKDKEAYTGTEFSDDSDDDTASEASEAEDVLDYDSGINW